jgi:hypothetical protein
MPDARYYNKSEKYAILTENIYARRLGQQERLDYGASDGSVIHYDVQNSQSSLSSNHEHNQLLNGYHNWARPWTETMLNERQLGNSASAESMVDTRADEYESLRQKISS